MIIELDDNDIRKADTVAHGRNNFDKKRIATQKFDDSLSDIQVDIIGSRGEMAVAKHLGCEPPTGISFADMKKHDMECNGRKIEVKTIKKDYGPQRSYLHGRKILNTKADIFYLAIPLNTELTIFRIGGYITVEDFKVKHKLHNFGWGNEPALPECELEREPIV